jgi:hypothetical protein
MPTVTEPLGNPGLRPDGTVTNATGPVPATSMVATTPTQDPRTASTMADRRLPQTVTQRAQAQAAGAK